MTHWCRNTAMHKTTALSQSRVPVPFLPFKCAVILKTDFPESFSYLRNFSRLFHYSSERNIALLVIKCLCETQKTNEHKNYFWNVAALQGKKNSLQFYGLLELISWPLSQLVMTQQTFLKYFRCSFSLTVIFKCDFIKHTCTYIIARVANMEW